MNGHPTEMFLYRPASLVLLNPILHIRACGDAGWLVWMPCYQGPGTCVIRRYTQTCYFDFDRITP